MIKQKKVKNKKAIFFSLDALIALVIILLSITVIYPILKYSEKKSSVPEDILTSLSALKIGEMGKNNLYVKGLINNGNIADLNKSVLEQIGIFYVSADPATKLLAKGLAAEVLSTIDTNENIGIWYGEELLASKYKTDYDNAKNVNVERQTISGIQEGAEITGFSARAFLTNTMQTKYYYFGGYVGEGNITLNVEYTGTLQGLKLELTANKNFKIYVNGDVLPADFQSTSDTEPKVFDDLSAYVDEFEEGVNEFKIVPEDGIINFHLAGGYLKITYKDGVQYEQPERHYFSGIEGMINLYDGFYVPGNLENLEVHLKAIVDDPEKKIYMKIGNEEIFKSSTGGVLTNLDYTSSNSVGIQNILTNPLDYSKKTIPIRIGIDGVDYEETEVIAEIFSDVPLTGSLNSDPSVKAYIDGEWKSGINAVKLANKKLVEILLELENLFVGLVPSRQGELYDIGYHELSQDSGSLKSIIDSWEKGLGNRNLCVNFQKSYEEFSNDADFKAIIFTIFDSPNQCDIWEGDPDFVGVDINEKIKNKICKLVDPDGPGGEDPKIKVYSVDVGLNEASSEAFTIQALKDIADCSGGKYVSVQESGGDFNDLLEAYKNIITTIKDLIFNMQEIDIINSADASSYLSPDSYIEFNYVKTPYPYGVVVSSEKVFDNSDKGSFNIPIGSRIVETRVISYSGARWTDEVKINGESIYDLSFFGEDYLELGDPYSINIPNSFIKIDEENNIIELTTGLSPINLFSGSPYNKIIYSVVKDIISYSPITSSANGCIWTVEFEDEPPSIMSLPEGATDICFYQNVGGIPAITCERAGVQGDCESSNDAIKIAVYNLFKKLDNDRDGRVDLKFEAQNLQVNSAEITGIPFPWETVVQVRKWW